MVQNLDIQKKIRILMNFFNLKKYDEVISKVKPLIKKFPKEIIYYNLHALSLSGLGNHEEGKKVLLNIKRSNPNNIFLLNNLGLIETKLNNYKEAQNYLKRAIEIRKDFVDANLNLANLHLLLNRGEESIKILKNLINENSQNYVVNFALGNAYQQMGKFEDSQTFFEKCLELNPNNTFADQSLSMMIRYDKNNLHYAKMREKINSRGDDVSKMYLSFALGKAEEDMGNYSKAFDFIKKGNEIKKSIEKYDISFDKDISSKTKEIFKNKGKIENLFNYDNRKNYIFIVGMPRSGTTLIEQIVSSHNKVYGSGELNFISNIVDKYFFNTNNFFKNIDKYEKEILNEARNYYEKNTNIFEFKEKFMTDKAPLNFRWIGFILMLFGNAKFINCKREAMDVCWSNYKNFFTSKKMNFSYSFYDLADYYKIYEDMLFFWKSEFPDKIIDIEYEKLIDDPEHETKKILKFCNLDWDENCLNFYKNSKTVSTASVAQVRNPIYKSSIKKWKNYDKHLEKLKKRLI